jgi:hypothetical protein
MEVHGNPLLEAEEWSRTHTCKVCSVYMSKITISDLIDVEGNHGIIKCGFCGEKQSLYFIPDSVKFTYSLKILPKRVPWLKKLKECWKDLFWS